MAMANGAIYPIVANQALSEFKENSTSAAGLMNFSQIMLCVIASGLVSSYSEYGVVAMTSVMLLQTFIVIIGYGLLHKQQKTVNLIESDLALNQLKLK